MGIEQFLLDQAKEEGIAKGEVKGMKKGMKEGIKEGIKEGVKEGVKKAETQKNRDFVRSLLLQTDLTLEKIATIVGVQVTFVEKMKSLL